eukprot:682338-Alexandrium_andersonii.AAC.1
MAACRTVWATAFLAGGAPKQFGKRGTAAGFSREHRSQMPRTRCSCWTIAHAGQSPGGRYRGAPGNEPRARRCARQVPSACGS